MEQRTCCFFGHRECFGLDEKALLQKIEEQIKKGTTLFYVGNQGSFDAMVRSVLKKLQLRYPHIQYGVVLAYLPGKKDIYDDRKDTIYPEGLEVAPRKFAIVKRNRWMVEQSAVCVCYINHTWGGAYKSVKFAERKGLEIINLGKVK